MKISIITVAFNSGESIRPTIESVLAQKQKNIEYRIIDGNSTDQTVPVAESYRSRMEAAGIDYHIISEPDGGIYDAMNKGIRLAVGDVIGILNSGDWYEPGTLGLVKKYFAKTHCALLFGDIRIYRTDGSSFVKKARLRRFQTSRDWNHPTMFVRAELYKENPFLNKGIHDDYGFYLKMRRMKVKTVIVREVLAGFRMGGASNKKSLKAALKRISDRYRYCYRANGYSRWYLAECVAIEAAKFLLG